MMLINVASVSLDVFKKKKKKLKFEINLSIDIEASLNFAGR